MYEIVLFSGGVYRFDELLETVEDVGGLVLKKDHFHKSRGTEFIGEEIRVMLVVPEKDKNIIESLSKDIKGNIDKLELNHAEKNNIITVLPIYDALSLAGSWINIEEIEDLIECPCPAQLCQNSQPESCVLDELDETLDKLCSAKIVEWKKCNKEREYRLLDDKEKND